ncbi:myb-like protein Q isoform X2 [Aedes albopictus]|uniref:Phosphatidylinositol 3,4,5-trisphosphate 3-phosphatase and dual-specificity protein phosphatase PTEN n=1 Tax=Aedes albopictus TaxID=7160 RepID=A0ABM1YAH6_AEDAL
MANTLSSSKMTNTIRNLVSKRRIRYTQDGFDLDLTYINDRIIAMGYPAEHMESIYRNKIEDVHKMLEKNHAGCYKIYNLCSERTYNHKRFPYYSVYPFKDHNPPDIELITSFCKDVDEHLRADSKNVVAVHCKAGKGRTGTMICCYLLYSQQFNTADEALHYYAQRRTSDSKGVTIPSQRRYVEYYASLLQSNEIYQPVTLYICEIRIAPSVNLKEGTITVTGQDPKPLPEFKRVGGGGTNNANSDSQQQQQQQLQSPPQQQQQQQQQQQLVAKMDYCMPLAGDIKIELVKNSVMKEKRCHFWFNTYFVERSAKKDAEGNLLLELSKSEIDDAHKDKHHKEYPSNFTVTLAMRRVPNGRFSESVTIKSTSPLISCTMDNNRQAHIFPQRQRVIQQQHQHHSPHQQQLLQQQQQQQHHPPHRQISSDPYRATMKHHNSSPGGFLQHDQSQQQQHHYHQQQQLNTLPQTQQQQQNNHQNHDPQQQQQQQQHQQYFKRSLENIQQQHYDADDSHQLHCPEYSESSSSESSTEEDGWDSGTAASSNIRHHHVTTPATTTTTTTTNPNIISSNSRNGNGDFSATFLRMQFRKYNHHHPDDHDYRPPPPINDKDDDEDYDDASVAIRTATSHGTCSPSGSRSSVTSAPEPSPVKPSSTIKSPIKKSASAVEAAVSTAANKLRRMSANAKFSFSTNNSSNTNCKSNNKPSTSSSAVSGSSNNKCDILNLLARSPSSSQQAFIAASAKGSNPSSPITSPSKLVGRSFSNDPTAGSTSAGGATSTSMADHLRRDSLPIIGGLLSSFSSSSVSSSNSSSLSTSTFGTGSNHQGLPLLGSAVGQPKPSKLQALFSVSSCYNGSHGRSDTNGKPRNGRRVNRTICYGDEEDDEDEGDGGGGGGGGGVDDDDDDNRDDDDVVMTAAAAAVAKVALGNNGTTTRRNGVPRKLGSNTASNSDSGRSSTEIGPADSDKDQKREQPQPRAAGNGCLSDLV